MCATYVRVCVVNDSRELKTIPLISLPSSVPSGLSIPHIHVRSALSLRNIDRRNLSQQTECLYKQDTRYTRVAAEHPSLLSKPYIGAKGSVQPHRPQARFSIHLPPGLTCRSHPKEPKEREKNQTNSFLSRTIVLYAPRIDKGTPTHFFLLRSCKPQTQQHHGAQEIQEWQGEGRQRRWWFRQRRHAARVDPVVVVSSVAVVGLEWTRRREYYSLISAFIVCVCDG